MENNEVLRKEQEMSENIKDKLDMLNINADSWEKAREIINEQAEKWREIVNKSRKTAEELIKQYPKQKRIIDYIYKNGWAFGNTIGGEYNIIIPTSGLLTLSSNEIDGLYKEYYFEKNGIDKELEELEDTLSLHKNTIHVIRETLTKAPNSWKILYPQLFAVADAIMIKISNGDLKVDKFTRLSDLSNSKKNVSEYKDIDESIFEYIHFKTLEMAESLWDFTSFGVSSSSVKFGRNSVQHGRYDPNNYSYEQFAKLISFVSTLAIFL